MFTCLKNNGLDDHPNTIASNSTHKKKATSKTASEAHGIDVSAMQFSRFYNTNLQLLFPLFPFYSHTRELVIDCFQSQDFSIFISSYFFFFPFLYFFTSFLPQHPNPRESSVIAQGREEDVYLNQTLWSVACTHFFSTCVLKLPYPTMTLPSLYLPHSHSP